MQLSGGKVIQCVSTNTQRVLILFDDCVYGDLFDDYELKDPQRTKPSCFFSCLYQKQQCQTHAGVTAQIQLDSFHYFFRVKY